jgi:hypothetical protein
MSSYTNISNTKFVIVFLITLVAIQYIIEIPNHSYTPITNTVWARTRLCILQKGCTRLAAASNKVYQLLAHGRWFPPGTLAPATTKTGRHDIAEILLKVALNTINQINHICTFYNLMMLITFKITVYYCHFVIVSLLNYTRHFCMNNYVINFLVII